MAKGNKERYGRMYPQFVKARAQIIKTQDVCALCGKPVDKKLRYPHPLSATVDHIIPVNRGGDLVDINNLQLAHLSCNIAKSDRISIQFGAKKEEVITNHLLPWSMDWKNYKAS